jgi:hypothetical protein
MTTFADRVKDTTTTTGLGDVTLSGTAPTGFVSFNAVFGTNVRFPYVICSNGGAEWEAGIGYLSGATTLVRDRVRASSNAGASVSLSSGTKDVICDAIAAYFTNNHGRPLSSRSAFP